ncbi:four-helix bundle copper-binding protein [Lentzea sp. BCCO 10_0798]|uniref:Four-helix bundle copper-binding protein n=1 Tax=Lentzea kristufekii TaxID=3095430 RepID=A0ABU4U9J9_9PSEU|nr:four-helix bundle copper-binding protein [Lentzea sp. BCCO 10_0798]MDX8056626.1 four-helix bundle copper-binding protein [Lentzea sp. BCCO 10_0798]
MTMVSEMLETYPADLGQADQSALVRCIGECIACAQACTACADACLSEADDQLPMLRKCIRSCVDCADICATAGRILSRHTEYDVNIARRGVRIRFARRPGAPPRLPPRRHPRSVGGRYGHRSRRSCCQTCPVDRARAGQIRL